MSAQPFSAMRFFFVKNTLAKLLMGLFLLGGVFAYENLVKETTPDLEIGIGIVITPWVGSDAASIESAVTNPIEKNLKSLKGVKRISSGSYAGASLVVVEFRPDVPQADAMTRLRTQVAAVEGDLPKAAEKPRVIEASINDTPIFGVRLHGPVPLDVSMAVAKDLKRRFVRQVGVGKISIRGGRDKAVNVRLSGARLSALGIPATQIRAALEQANVDLPFGTFEGARIGAGFRMTGKFRDVDALRAVPIGQTRGGRMVRLDEVADVAQGLTQETTRTAFSAGGGPFAPAVDISVTKRGGADAIRVIRGLKAAIETAQAEARWPHGLEVSIVTDNAKVIRADLRNILNNGWQAMLAVFVILLVALTWREALVAGIAIPVTFAASLGVIYLLGYSLNQIVIIGMVLALGLLVDDFILVMEGMHEHLFLEKMSFEDAALATVRTYALPSLSGSLTTILAMAPLLSIAGLEGKFIRQMPIAAIMSLCASYVVSIFLAIPLSALVLRAAPIKETAVDRLTARGSAALAQLLRTQFTRTRARAWAWALFAAATFAAAGLAFSTVPSALGNKGDGRALGVTVELSAGSTLETTQRCADALGAAVQPMPFVQSVTKHVGEKSPFSVVTPADQLSPGEGLHLAGLSVVFTPKDQRDRMLYTYVPEVRRALDEALLACPGGTLVLTPELGGASAEDPVQLVVFGPDMDVLRRLSREVMAVVRAAPGTEDVRTNMGAPRMEYQAVPRAEPLSFHGLSATELALQVRAMMAHDKVGAFAHGAGVGLSGPGDDALPIHMGYAWPSRGGGLGGPTSPDELEHMRVIGPRGSIPLPSVVRFRLAQSALSILHVDTERSITVMSKVTGQTPGEVLAVVLPQLRAAEKTWPAGYRLQVAGEAEASKEVFGSAARMLVLALVLVFALLVLQFDSFLQPFIIMSAIPLALTGTFLGFFALQMPFSFMAMVGVIALVGIVVNDTIIMIETMNTHRAAGMAIAEAAARGAADRLRPILTTSLTTIVGLVPLGLSQPMWGPLAVTVIAGLVFATVLALLIVPCLYVLFTRAPGPRDA